MKKIVCLILAVACCFALFACGEEVHSQAEFFTMIEGSEPTNIQTQTSLVRPNGISYNGYYVTAMTDDGFVFDYQYEQRAAIVAGGTNEGSKEVKSGEIVYKNGLYSVDGGDFVAEAPDVDYLGLKLDINATTLPDGSFEMSRDGKTMIAELSAAQIKTILGIDAAADTVELRITVDGVRLSKISVAYTTAEGSEVLVETSYTYGPIADAAE